MKAFYKTISLPATRLRLQLFSSLFIISLFTNAQTVVWQDNFDDTTLNTNNWIYEFGNGCERGICGWGNAELEYYTSRPENVRIDTGNLVIEARRENFQTKSFTSGRIKSFGRVQFKYGTLEARIKVPNLKNGLWPAFWTLGTTGTWPASGEIDILEMGMAASYPDNVNRWTSSATHWLYQGSQADYGQIHQGTTDLNNDYHIYKMVWTATAITVFIDGVQTYAINTTGADMEEFHKPQYVLFNMAVGGNFTGIPTDAGVTAALPSQMLVDWVKLTQSPGDELYLGAQHAPFDNYGIFTETTPVQDSITYGTDANLYYWNNIANIANATPFEGNNVLALRAEAGNWFGFGVSNDPKFMMNYTNGSLRFNFKTTYAGQFKVGVTSGFGESWINFPAGSSQYGLVRDGNWHEVTIPLTAFDQPNLGMHIDLGSMNALFMFAGDAPATTADMYFDNIYYAPCASGVCQLLPVKLLNYTAKLADNKKVIVSWTTATEINNDRFIIERSTDGRSFKEIGTVAAAGSGNAKKSYALTDENPVAGVNYYRLVQMDKDGRKTFYDVKRVNLLKENVEISVYPNPVKGANLNIILNQATQRIINIQLVDLLGKVIMMKNEKPNGNTVQMTLDTKPAAGLYLLKIDGKVITKVVIE